ncbi:unnamed protein product [Closterium sp. NIES-65]|nr:unnamed protein product [Closterium sp. NIES-65]
MTLPVPYGWDTYTVLAAWLLRERAKGAASPWALFLRSLPAYVPLPALFPQQLIDQFEYWPIVDQATRLKAAYADLYDRCNSNPTTIVHAYSLLFSLCSPSPPRTPPQATRLKAAYADLYDRCNSSNLAAIANATRSEFYWALTIVTSRCFTFSPSMRARGGGEEQQAEGAEGAEGGRDGSADGAEVAANVVEAVATEEAGGESEEGSTSSSSNSGGSGRRAEDWYATSAAMLPFADLFNHDYYPNMGWKVTTFFFTTYQAMRAPEALSQPFLALSSCPLPRPITPLFPPLQLSGDHFLFTTYQAIEEGEPLSISYGAKPSIDMVAEYGFVPSYNPYDTVILFPSHSKPTIDVLAEYGFVPAYNPYDSVELFPSPTPMPTIDMLAEYGFVPAYNPHVTVILLPSIHMLSLHIMPSIHRLSLHIMPSIHMLSLHIMPSIHMLSLHIMPSIHMLSLHIMPSIHRLSLHIMASIHMLSLHIMPSIHMLSLHIMPSIRMLSLHIMPSIHMLSLHIMPSIHMLSLHILPSIHMLSLHIMPSIHMLSSARLVEYAVQQTHPTQPHPTQSHPAYATLRGALRVAASVREVVERMREERRTGVQKGQGRAEEEGEGQEAQGERGQGGDGKGEEAQREEGQGEEGQRVDTSGDGSTGGEWWEGMESEEDFESAKKQLVVWAGGHASPEMLAMAAAVWHWIDTGRGESKIRGAEVRVTLEGLSVVGRGVVVATVAGWAGGHVNPEILAMAAAVWHWIDTGRELDAEQLATAAMHLSAPILDNGKPFTDDDYDGGAGDAQAADTWQQLAQSTSADILSSLSAAACAIQQRVRALLGVGLTGEEKRQAAREASEAESRLSGGWSFSTDYYEDEDRLRELVACRGGRYRSASEILAGDSGEASGEEDRGSREGDADEGEQTDGSAGGSAGGSANKPVCSPGVMRWVHERETVLQFRMVKKSILSEADVAMGEWCRSMGRAAS